MRGLVVRCRLVTGAIAFLTDGVSGLLTAGIRRVRAAYPEMLKGKPRECTLDEDHIAFSIEELSTVEFDDVEK